MKSVYLIAIMLSLLSTSLINIYAYEDFAPIGATWYFSDVKYSDTSQPKYTYKIYTSIGDSFVNGKKCRIVVSDIDTIFYYYQDGKVYNLFKNQFLLTYNFTAKKGDTISIDFRDRLPMKNNYQYPHDTFYTAKCVVKDVKMQNGLKHFYTKLIPLEERPYLQLIYSAEPYEYNYIERTGYDWSPLPALNEFVYPTDNQAKNRINFNNFLLNYPFLLRCYQEDTIFYQSQIWRDQNIECDYEDVIDKKQGLSNQKFQFNFTILPTSSPGVFEINIENHSFIKLRLLIISLQGIVVYTTRITQRKLIFDISNLPNSIYNVLIYDGTNYISTKKILKL